jgi:glycosyltransferase involved in cell wall biosynthesis
MNKMLFLIFHDLDNSGISRKILLQASSFINHGIEVDLSYIKKNEKNEYFARIINKKILETYKDCLFIKGKYKWRYKFRKILQYIEQNNIDIIYIRYTHFANPFFIYFLLKIKKMKKKVILEIPTYPYDYEYLYSNLAKKLLLIVEKVSRRQFKYYVDLVVCPNAKNKIFGIPTVEIENPINISEIKIRHPIKKEDNIINLIAVSSMNYWDGYDRVIKGMHSYYSRNNNYIVYLHLVGPDNEESRKYKLLAKRLKVGKYVFFHPYIIGEELDRLFDISDLGIGCLASFRKKIISIKPLKHREYCARGIPFIYAGVDSIFEGKDFVLKAPLDESAIRIEDIVSFIKSLNINYIDIRKFAERNLTWDQNVKNILNSLNKK